MMVSGVEIVSIEMWYTWALFEHIPDLESIVSLIAMIGTYVFVGSRRKTIFVGSDGNDYGLFIVDHCI